MSADPTATDTEVLPGPPAGLEENTEMEFQVAPMVDVLLVLLLFFMATTTTEVITQQADLNLPKAEDSTAVKKGIGELIVNVEKLNYRIKLNDVYYDEPNDIVPIIRGAYQQYKAGSPDKDFRVIIRADEKTPFQRISGIMKACADASVLDVIFMAADDKAGQPKEEAK
jgi:biopolymer transport protein ExbD